MITNEQEYEQALKRADEIFDCKDFDSPEGKELQKLLEEIKAYEDVHYPIIPKK